MELSQLHYFLHVARTQHMTHSAQALHIAQPALTQAIHKLEADLGVPLFAPKGRGIVLTDYGKYLQKELTPLLARLDELPDQLQVMAKLKGATIHLNVLAASAMVTEAIIQYQHSHEDVRFQFLQSAQDALCDIEITSQLVFQPIDGATQFACAERILLAVPNSGPFAHRTSIHLQEMAQEGFISLMGSRQLRSACDSFCRQVGFTPQVIFESDSPAAVQNMIAARMGVGFWPELTWGRPDSSQVKLLPIEDAFCQRDLVVTCHFHKQDQENVLDFFRFFCEFCRARQKSLASR